MALDTSTIKELIKLLVDNKLDTLEFEGLKITRSRHEILKAADNKSVSSHQETVTDPDELLFWSTSTPSLTQEQISALAFSDLPTPKSKRIRKSKEQS
jgi:hypothetical protein